MTKRELLKDLADAKRRIGVLQYWLRQPGKLDAKSRDVIALYRMKASEIAGLAGNVELALSDELYRRIRVENWERESVESRL